MFHLIGEKLDKVIDYFNTNGIKYQIEDNNFSVDGDTKLVTNIKKIDDYIILVVGSFIFDVENKNFKIQNT